MSSEKEINEEPETTTAKVDERPDTEQKEPEFEKSKKGRLSFRRKRKKSKATDPELDNSAQDEKKEEKQEAENPPEGEETPKTAMSSETEPNEETAAQNEENVQNADLTDVKEKKKGSADKDGKEKVSRPKKFKRWASFSKKQKKDGSTTDSGSNETTKQTKQKSDDLELEQVSPDKVMTVDGENNAEENVNTEGNNESSRLSKQERRKRAVSFAETVKYHDDELLAEPEPRKRSASFGEDTTVESFDAVIDAVIANEEKISHQPKETSHDPEPEQLVDTQDESNSATDDKNNTEVVDTVIENASLDKDKDEDNDLESLSDVEQKDAKTDDEYATATGDMTGEENDIENKQPKKKKKRFLRKLSSKNIKTSKKENKPLTKSDISSPLELLDSESAANEDVGEQSEPEEKCKENSSKRKKSILGLKLPKALKKRKSSAGYKAVTGAEAEEEMKKDEELQNKDDKEENASEEQATCETTSDVNPPEKQEETTKEEEQPAENIEKPTENSEEDVDKDLCKDGIIDNDNNEQCETKVNEEQGQQSDDSPTQDLLENKEETNTSNEPEQIAEQTTEVEEKAEEKDLHNEETDKAEEMKREQSSTSSEINEGEANKEEANSESVEQDEEENNDNISIQDSSLSVSEITLIEMGDESSLLAVPIEKDNAQQHDIHELPSIQSPEVTQEKPEETSEPSTNVNNDAENEVKTENSEVPSSTNESEVVPSVSRPLSPEVCSTLRSFEMSVRTKAMVDSYILIDQQLEVSQDFLAQVELMDNRKNKCFVM